MKHVRDHLPPVAAWRIGNPNISTGISKAISTGESKPLHTRNRKRRPAFGVILMGILTLGLCSTTHTIARTGELKLASPFTSHMVLQSNASLPIWGWAKPTSGVRVTLGDQTQTSTADAAGKWQVTFSPLPPSSQPREMIISSDSDSVKLTDVLVGEVWLASGQSNMALTVSGCRDAEKEIAAADHPLLRLFQEHGHPSLTPSDTAPGQWAVCSPASVGGFSGAGYYFGRQLQQSLGVPVGVINASWGGTTAEQWTPLDALQSNPVFAKRASEEMSQAASKDSDTRRYAIDIVAWQKKYCVVPPPITEGARNWADPAFVAQGWKTIAVPTTWANAGFSTGGVFWLRKHIKVPNAEAAKEITAWLQHLEDDGNTFYWNGIEIGKNSYRYDIPPKLVKIGDNLAAVRITSATQNSGEKNILIPIPGQNSIDDKWLVKQEQAFPALTDAEIAERPKANRISVSSVSSSLYNGMIHPLIPFAIKGVIWYQGESNVGRPVEYRQLLPLLISDWRRQWGQRDFPFIIQQLPNNGIPTNDPNQPGWASFREAQMQIAQAVPDCAIAIGIDLGEGVVIHPKNKQDIGSRLAMVALDQAYGKPVESSGPRYESMKIEGHSIRIRFTHAAGLKSRDGQLKRFAIAGADRKFVWADAKVDGQSVIVSSPKVPAPVAVRYAWSQNPDGCNLTNDTDLPAAPFRTDAW
jgi:sialate O-acetylesterase